MTTTPLDAWLRWPDQCSAAIDMGPRHYRREDPCGKPAVAVAIYDEGPEGEYEPHAYPVCKHHARGRRMMPLAEILAAARNGGSHG